MHRYNKILSLFLGLMLFLQPVQIVFAQEQTISQVNVYSSSIEPSEAVDDSYFDDAVFIGDSLTLSIESRHVLPKATFIADIGARISAVASGKIFQENGNHYSILEILAKHEPGKIYILIGTNTLTFSRSMDAIEQYRELLNVIIKEYPLTPIYLISLPTFRNFAVKKTQEKHPDFSNKRILDYNKRLKVLAEDMHCNFLDLCTELMTSKNDIQPKKEFIAPDGYHFSLEGAEAFKNFIKTHTIGQ